METYKVLSVRFIPKNFNYKWKWRHKLYEMIDVPFDQLYLMIDMKEEFAKVQDE